MTAGARVAPRVVLASASPRRRELLAQICEHFTVVPSAIAEELSAGTPGEAAVGVALAKARAVAANRLDAVVIGADTIVVVDHAILGKPASADRAMRMLRQLRNRVHDVVTGVAVLAPGGDRELTAAVVSRVTMRDYSDADIEQYVATGEPLDKAGAYAVQERGGQLVARVDGCLTNVIGLPLSTTRRLLAALGVMVRESA